jgi:hypothetical protein
LAARLISTGTPGSSGHGSVAHATVAAVAMMGK